MALKFVKKTCDSCKYKVKYLVEMANVSLKKKYNTYDE